MARTLIGELLLRVKADTKEVQTVSNALRQIEQDSKRLNASPWGLGLQRQLDKLKATPRELDLVRRSWDNLISGFQSRNLTAAMRKNDISVWRQSTVTHLTAVRAEWKRLGDGQESAMRRFREAARFGVGTFGVYSLTNAAARGGRAASTASAERQRELFRQEMAGLPEKDRALMSDRAVELSGQYPSASATQIMEMARIAYTTMGSAERGNDILPGLVKGLVTLQSTKGVDVATQTLASLLNGIDNLGKNSLDEIGVKNTLDIIDGAIRAAQIEGGDFDPAKMFEFARRSKIAGPGLSTEFIMTTSPAMMQDMTASGFGNALSSAYQAFVIGANSNSSKINVQAQRDLGLRSGTGNNGKGELVDSDLFGTDLYAWATKNLIPALERSGLDLENDTAVAKAVAQLTKNTNASGMLTRMITQRDQIDRKREQYTAAMGTSAADSAAVKDPFVAWGGFKTSFENLSAAIGETVMPVIVPGLNSVSGALNAFGKSLKDGNVLAWSGLAVGGAAVVGGPIALLGKAGWDLITAGTALKGSAAALDAAAARLGASGGMPGGPDDKTPPKGNRTWSAITAALGKAATVGAVLTTATSLLSDSPGDTFEEQAAIQANRKDGLKRDLNRYFGWAGDRNFWLGDSSTSIRDKLKIDTDGTFASNRASSDGSITPQVNGEQALQQAHSTAEDIRNALNVTVGPTVDLAGLSALQAKLQACVATLQQLAVGIPSTVADLNSQLRRSFADHQITP
ncbi:hypothetical protein [Ochrobactrum sp. AN78]|uniref:hypothetical protein n=1 Tax=Ochrobactrum sp. AN78 TaxID=3039853 RepID=UPI002989E5A0|nr:hypothetical protein [Ochrobactrum sp. AN78]MDH7789157.1 hypothetical protein [Ochrobactrum sp. AN78]